TLAKIMPLSSSGTKPDGVDLNRKMASPVKANKRTTVIHFLLTMLPTVLVYLLVMAVNPTLKALKKRVMRLVLCPFSGSCGFRNNAAKAGLSVKALMAEIRMA